MSSPLPQRVAVILAVAAFVAGAASASLMMQRGAEIARQRIAQGTPIPSATSAPSPTPTPLFTPAPTPTRLFSGPPADERYGLIAEWHGEGFELWSETGIEAIQSFHTSSVVSVAPDGRSFAYWQVQPPVAHSMDPRPAELRVVDARTRAARTLLRLEDDHSYTANLVWSTDGTGLAAAVHAGGRSEVRLVDVRTGASREVFRIAIKDPAEPSASFFLMPLAWDRARGIVAVADRRVTSPYDDSALPHRSYYMYSERSRRLVRQDFKTHVRIGRIATDTAARYVVAIENEPCRTFVCGSVIAWPLEDLERAMRRAPSHGDVHQLAFRPGTLDLVVMTAGPVGAAREYRLEFWPDLGRGTPRVLTDQASFRNDFIFRWDGSAVIWTCQCEASFGADLVDLDTGGRTTIDISWQVASLALR
jgi:hypothetical protein